MRCGRRASSRRSRWSSIRRRFRAIGVALGTFRKVSAERVRDEWKKTMKAARPSRAFDVMRETGLLGVTCPELLEGWGMEQNKWHSYDVWRHGMECMDACIGDPVLRIAALLHDVGKPRSRAFSDKTQDFTFYEHERIGAEIADPIAQRLQLLQRRAAADRRARAPPPVPLRRLERRGGAALAAAGRAGAGGGLCTS